VPVQPQSTTSGNAEHSTDAIVSGQKVPCDIVRVALSVSALHGKSVMLCTSLQRRKDTQDKTPAGVSAEYQPEGMATLYTSTGL
jgi:hypothetical protein